MTVITVTQQRSCMTDTDWVALADLLPIKAAFALFPPDARPEDFL